MTDGSRRFRVVKFGGSTMGAHDRIDSAVRMVLGAVRSIQAVVVSAPGDLTDRILELTGHDRDPADASRLAHALAHGEILGATVLHRALENRGIACRLILPDTPEWPIITRGPRLQAEIDISLSQPRVQRLLDGAADETMVVIPGCIGIERESGEWTSLGRGGGDTTTVALARCRPPAEAILVKDVPGVLMADPAAIPEAELIEELSVDEMGALSETGASVVASSALAHVTRETTLRVIGLGASLELSTGTTIRHPRNRPPEPAVVSAPGVLGRDSPLEWTGPWVVVTVLPKPLEAAVPGAGPEGVSNPRSVHDASRRPLRIVVAEDDLPRTMRHFYGSGDVRAIASRRLDSSDLRRLTGHSFTAHPMPSLHARSECVPRGLPADDLLVGSPDRPRSAR